jgi:hypothetical protein
MASPSKPESSASSPRPWIVSLAYWNDVAKDVVKAICVTFVIYIGGVLVGVFKLHTAIVVSVLGLLVAILSWAVGLRLKGRASFVLPYVISSVVTITATTVTLDVAGTPNDLPLPAYFGMGAGATALIMLLGVLLSMLFRKSIRRPGR